MDELRLSFHKHGSNQESNGGGELTTASQGVREVDKSAALELPCRSKIFLYPLLFSVRLTEVI